MRATMISDFLLLLFVGTFASLSNDEVGILLLLFVALFASFWFAVWWSGFVDKKWDKEFESRPGSEYEDHYLDKLEPEDD